MRLRNIVVFVFAVAVSLFAASHRWGDSAHAIGVISTRGGKVKHPVILESGKGRYVVLVTARVMPPYAGDVRVVLEGKPEVEHEFFVSEPAVDLRLSQRPVFRNGTLHGLRPKDRLALWVIMKPPVNVSQLGPERPDRVAASATYALCFYDTRTGDSVLRAPVIHRRKGEVRHEG